MKTLITKDEEATQVIARQIALHLQAGDVLLLEGDLGAGKTTFTKGLGLGLGISRIIKSPTYTIIREYTDGRLPLYHIDLYRLDEEEAAELGLYEYFEGDGVTVVEWSSVAPSERPSHYLEITLATLPSDPMQRQLTFDAKGQRYEKLLAKLEASLN